jgi:acyl carrier protein
MNIREKVFKVISQIMSVPLETISMDSSPDSIENWDSLRHMNLILDLEQEFNIQFADDQIVDMLNAELLCIGVEEILRTG